jgi:tetratricopeptide (TPR) repeat protein
VAWQQHKGPDLWGNTRIGFESRLTLLRKDYGVAGPVFWNNAISNQVEIELRISAEIPNFDLWGFPSPEGKKPVGAVVYDSVEKDGVRAAIQQYKALKQEHPDTYAFTPGQLNLVGRRLLQHCKNQEALEIFKLNAELFPDMAGISDSLGDAYIAVGDSEHAIQTFKKSLAIDPTDTSAAESLRTLTHG